MIFDLFKIRPDRFRQTICCFMFTKWRHDKKDVLLIFTAPWYDCLILNTVRNVEKAVIFIALPLNIPSSVRYSWFCISKNEKIDLDTPFRIVFQFMRRRTSAASNVRPGISHEEKKISESCYFERGLAHKITSLI